jgi:hypothetical protein
MRLFAAQPTSEKKHSYCGGCNPLRCDSTFPFPAPWEQGLRLRSNTISRIAWIVLEAQSADQVQDHHDEHHRPNQP